MLPALLVLSPQAMLAVKLPAVAWGSAAVKEAITPPREPPWVAARSRLLVLLKGDCSGNSEMVRTPMVGAPRLAPPVGLLKVRLTVWSASPTAASSRIGIVKV